jgi:hypothetical protein
MIPSKKEIPRDLTATARCFSNVFRKTGKCSKILKLLVNEIIVENVCDITGITE